MVKRAVVERVQIHISAWLHDDDAVSYSLRVELDVHITITHLLLLQATGAY